MITDNPSLRGLLADPLIKLVMASDGVAEGDILALARRHQARQSERPTARRAMRGALCGMLH